jgi:glycosyltransferase involved in cell wall biosynthesis
MTPHSSIDSIQIHRLADHDVLTVAGWAFDENGEPAELSLELNGEKTDFRYDTVVRPDVEQRFMHQSSGIYYSGFRGISEYNRQIQGIRLYSGKRIIFSGTADEIGISEESIVYDIEETGQDRDGNVEIRGWVLSLNHAQIHISVNNDRSGQTIPADIRKLPTGRENDRQGFIVIYRRSRGEKAVIHFSSDSDRKIEVPVAKAVSRDYRMIGLIKKVNPRNIKKFFSYCRRFGFSETVKMAFAYKDRMDYDKWFRRRRATAKTLEEQRQHGFNYSPTISILIPAYNTPVDLLKKTIGSVQAQSYENWQLCIAFAGDDNAPAFEVLKRYQEDKRIKVRFLDENQGISENTNRALELADGDYIALFDHDDLLEADALFEIVKAINENLDALAFYTDEDKYDPEEKRFVDPNLKPEFDIDLLRSCNYITHFLVVRSDLMGELGGLRKEYDGAQDYDLILRIAEKAGMIQHIPRILYHWRMMVGSTALAPESKNYAYTSGVKALNDHLRRCGIAAEAQMQEKPNYGLYNVYYEPVSEPLISIVFNGKNNAEARSKCIDSIREKNSYDNIEFAENTDEAKGSLLLFLDENTELINPDSIRNMAGFFERQEVGVVGAKLLYEDETVEHAGIIVGIDGFAEYANRGIESTQPGYMMRALLNCDYSAVSGACLMTRRSLYEELHGFDTEYRVCGKDIDYCLRVRRKDLLVVYNVTSLWYHSVQKLRRQRADYDTCIQAEKDIALFQERFAAELAAGDPYYNPGFATRGRTFCLNK